MFKSKNIKISEFTLKSMQPFFKAQSISGKFQRRFTGIQFFEGEFTANYMAENIGEVKEFVSRHIFGRPFSVPMSYFTKYDGDVKEMVTAAANVSRGGRKVTLSNFRGTLKAGTVIQFENHKKLYTITEDVKGNGEMKLFPNLRQNILAGETIRYQNPEGEFVLKTDKIDWKIAQIGKMKFEFVENV
ncbi:hypothetical protein JT459_000823 [Salmonella enterica]|nr:hypothetical protein [Salmonella enterica]ECO7735895.1 hypothetical protein [Salmonella enterica]EHC1824541.1 hypothetical protein [Salmonella enterica]EJE7996389.1 hypothetical protein [Salmonella enterica]